MGWARARSQRGHTQRSSRSLSGRATGSRQLAAGSLLSAGLRFAQGLGLTGVFT